MPPADEGPTQTLKALLRLRELVLSGEFAPGHRVSEIPLAARLGVSRTPLRAALSRLEHEGLLDTAAGGGFVVRAFTLADVHDAIELRGVLEGTAARLAAERLESSHELDAIRECLARLDAAVLATVTEEAFARYVELNERFHALLAELAKSAILRRSLDRVIALPFASPSAFVRAELELAESRTILVVGQEHHRGLIEAIERREGARAEALGREHARLARRNLDLALGNRAALERLPGASLIALGGGV